MSAPGFTPRPWTVTDERSLTPREPYWIGSEHPEVGRCTFATVRSGCDEAYELGSMLANAHLIAAAPAMYAELERLCDVIGKYGPEGVVEEALAVLALARGEPTPNSPHSEERQ